jgi:hypothetical protein
MGSASHLSGGLASSNGCYQAHGDGSLSGIGLGLFVSKQIVDLHGGTIEAQFPPMAGRAWSSPCRSTSPGHPQ